MNTILAILHEHYGMASAKVTPQRGGWSALAYHVAAGKQNYFLKLYEKSRSSTPKWTALIDDYVPVLLWLHARSGLQGSIPVPRLTKDGQFKCEDENGIYLLYDYIDGETIADKELTREQVRQLSEIIAELHAHGDEVPGTADKLRESFELPFLRRVNDILGKEAKFAALPKDMRELLQPRLGRIQALMETVGRLAESLGTKAKNTRMSLCHTDIHHWNLMQSGQRLILIDWEGLRLAPVEADLMFLVDKPYFNEFMKGYTARHKGYEIDTDALRFYQGRRTLEDLWEFMEQLLYDAQEADERVETLRLLSEMLEELSG